MSRIAGASGNVCVKCTLSRYRGKTGDRHRYHAKQHDQEKRCGRALKRQFLKLSSITERHCNFFSYPLETIRSVRAIVKADMRDELEEVHRRGVRVIIIYGVEDRVFPHAAMHEYMCDALLVETGSSHAWYLLEPARYAKLVLQAPKQ